jgi:hypothetical protein
MIQHVEWGTVFAAATSLAALILSYLSFQGQRAIRYEAIRDRRSAQARLTTAWWTRVRKDTGEDLALGDVVGPESPAEAGYRVWVSNSSNEAIYDCLLSVEINATPELIEQLATSSLVWRPYMQFFEDRLVIPVTTLAPASRLPYRVDPTLVKSLGSISISFTDSNGVKWRRVAGALSERSATATSRPTKGALRGKVSGLLRGITGRL